MNRDKKLDQSLKHLNKDIHWNEDRQQHIRNKFIHKMRQKKDTRLSTMRRKLVPACSIVLTLVIVTVILLNEFDVTHIMTRDESSYRTARDNGNAQTHIDVKEDKQLSEDNQAIPENDVDDHVTSPNDESGPNESQKDVTKHNLDDRLLTQQEIMEAIKGQMTSNLPLQLPKEITVPEGKRLTAVTSSSQHEYEVTFYQHDEPIPINNKLLFSDDNPAEVIARVHVKKYDTQEQADDAVSYEVFDEHMGEAISLNEELTGYQHTQDGFSHTSWNVGRWALTARAHSDDTQGAQSLAQNVVDYLDVYMLPAPQQNGYAHLVAEQGDNRIVWQKEATVYTIDQVTNPFKALEITVNFE